MIDEFLFIGAVNAAWILSWIAYDMYLVKTRRWGENYGQATKRD